MVNKAAYALECTLAESIRRGDRFLLRGSVSLSGGDLSEIDRVTKPAGNGT